MKFLLLIIFLIHGIAIQSQEWKGVCVNNTNDTIFIETSTIKEENGIVKAWIKYLYNDLEMKKEIVNHNIELIHKNEYRNGIPPRLLLKWTKFKYQLSLELFDLNHDKMKTIRTIYYTEDGEVLKSNDLEDYSKFEYIVPGSVGSIIFEEVYNIIK